MVSTGYGRRSFISSNTVIPEIVCHASGPKFLLPSVRSIINIGGQDSKVIERAEVEAWKSDRGMWSLGDEYNQPERVAQDAERVLSMDEY